MKPTLPLLIASLLPGFVGSQHPSTADALKPAARPNEHPPARSLSRPAAVRSRPSRKAISCPLIMALFLPLAAYAAAPSGLKAEFLENPLGLDTVKPRLSWIVENSTPGAKQTAYQVQAASTPEKLDSPDLWVSGKVDSDQSHLVEYGGKPLASRQKAWWRVKTWEQDGRESDWSEPAWFEMALLEQSDWSARWIAAELHMGTWTHVANRLSDGKQTEPTNQTELNLCQK